MELDKLRKQALLLERYEELNKTQTELNVNYDDFEDNDTELYVSCPDVEIKGLKGIIHILKKAVGKQLLEVKKEIDNL